MSAFIMAPRHRALYLSESEFEALVRAALDGLPEPYAGLVENVAVVVEEKAPREVLDDLEIDNENDLLGLYHGTSLDKESFFQAGGNLPARISIYRKPILRICRTREEVVQEVRDTVVHEIGHHFGLDDDEMPY
jgi:predicted Zn-dependent protease with MMP-like domain